MKGIIIKGIAGFYYVKAENKIYECKARGVFKNKGIKPVVGDIVNIEVLNKEEAVVEEIYPRKNEFIRPPIANVDLIIIVISAEKPKPNMHIIDSFLVMAEKSNTEVALCINKIDVADAKILKDLDETYDSIYKVVHVSGRKGQGLDHLTEVMKDRKVAFAGPSGVGKSTILNFLEPSVMAETGDISKKTKRGKHTTRHVEIYDMTYGGMLYDTPGFTSFDVLEASEEELQDLYPEIREFSDGCKYHNCKHIKEPHCAVRDAVKAERIKESRYESYLAHMEQIREKQSKW